MEGGSDQIGEGKRVNSGSIPGHMFAAEERNEGDTGPNGSCLFAAGTPADNFGSQNFQTFSTRQTPHLGD